MIDEKKFAFNIIRKNLRRFLLQMIAITLTLIIVIIASIAFVSSVTWYSSSVIYKILKFIADNVWFFIIGVWLLAVLVVLIFEWRKNAKNFIQLAKVVQDLSLNPETVISLPQELNELEKMLIGVQYQILDNRQKAFEAEQRKNDMLVYLAHDLKTPLTSVIGYLSLLQDEKEISDATKDKYIGIATDKALRLEELLNEFFEITRYNLHEMVLQKEEIKFTMMLEQICDEFIPLLNEKNLNYSLECKEDIVIFADAGKLERMIDNLIRNAINYSYNNTEIAIKAFAHDENVILSVQNQGQTIAKEKLEKIFEQFYRADVARTAYSGGSGLGLAISKEIVELHGGTIFAKSENNVTVFTITIPL